MAPTAISGIKTHIFRLQNKNTLECMQQAQALNDSSPSSYFALLEELCTKSDSCVHLYLFHRYNTACTTKYFLFEGWKMCVLMPVAEMAVGAILRINVTT
jgi:hypothetical protein